MAECDAVCVGLRLPGAFLGVVNEAYIFYLLHDIHTSSIFLMYRAPWVFSYLIE